MDSVLPYPLLKQQLAVVEVVVARPFPSDRIAVSYQQHLPELVAGSLLEERHIAGVDHMAVVRLAVRPGPVHNLEPGSRPVVGKLAVRVAVQEIRMRVLQRHMLE